MLLDELRMAVKVQHELLDPRTGKELHVVRAEGAAEDRNDRFGKLVGERAQARSESGGEDHPLHGGASSAALAARADRIGSSFFDNGRIRGFLSKFDARCATVGGMKRR